MQKVREQANVAFKQLQKQLNVIQRLMGQQGGGGSHYNTQQHHEHQQD